MDIKEKIRLASELLQLKQEDIENNSGIIEELSALYVSIPVKGGDSLIIGDDGSVLYADSSVGYSQHLESFKKGIRTPIEAFDRKSKK